MEDKKTIPLEARIKEQFTGQPTGAYKVSTYGELAIGDKCIALPLPGDNHGHGGFRGTHWIYEKMEKRPDSSGLTYENAKRLTDGVLSGWPDSMPVIKIE